jgi:hypothetical protein
MKEQDMSDKYCEFCKQFGHWLSECYCTRPSGWSVELQKYHLMPEHPLLKPKEEKPFGYWHVGATEEESDFFLYEDSGDVSCPDCIPLYKRK